MSRHELAAKVPNCAVVVGWDPPLATFFGIVYDTARPSPESERGTIVRWVGTGLHELGSLDDLVPLIEPYAEIPCDLRHVLLSDRRLGK